MNILTIQDLAITCELDRSAMVRVRGGYKASQQPASLYSMPSLNPSYNSSIDVHQGLQQLQQVENATANGSAFIDGTSAYNTTSQFGQNNVMVLR